MGIVFAFNNVQDLALMPLALRYGFVAVVGQLVSFGNRMSLIG